MQMRMALGLMKRSYSLKKNREFHFVYRTGKSYGGRSAVLIVARSRHKSVRVGFSVSKKIGNAVVRNLVKRRLREAFRPFLHQIRPGNSLIFVARESAASESFQSLSLTVEKLLRKAKLIGNPPAINESPVFQSQACVGKD